MGSTVERIPEFGEILHGLMSIDNHLRGHAEKQFARLKSTSPESLSMHLLEVLLNATEQRLELRSFAIVLLRGMLTRHGNAIFHRLSPRTQQVLKVKLLDALRTEPDARIRRKTSEMVGELGQSLIDEDGDLRNWAEILPFVFENLTAADAAFRECALGLLQKLARFVANSLPDHHAQIVQVLRMTIVQAPSEVTVAAMRAWTELVLHVGNAADRRTFAAVAPEVVGSISVLLENHKEFPAALMEALQLLIEVCERHTKCFESELERLVQILCQVLISRQFDASTRQLSLEVLVTMVENKPHLFRKLGTPPKTFVSCAVPAVFEMMLELDDIPDELQWATTASSLDEEDDDNFRIFCTGAAGLDRLASALGAKHVLPLTLEIIAGMAARSQWQARHAALVAISQISEVIPSEEPQYGEIVQTVVGFTAQDPHPKVRSAGVAALGNLCVDGAPKLQESHHAIVLPTLMDRLEKDVPRIKARAATAIDFFIEGVESIEVLKGYVDVLLENLFRNLAKEPTFVKEAIVPAISSLAYRCEAHFERFYAPSMPILKNLSKTNASNTLLRAKIIECIAHIGKSAGRDRFRADALWLISFIKEQQDTMTCDEERACILSAWCSLCESLGEEFKPYLGALMPSLLQMASIQVDYEALAAQFDDERFGDADGDFNASARTSDIDDKVTACSMLAHLCHEMGPSFFPYVEQTSAVLGPLVLTANELHEDIRATAVAALPDLVSAVSRNFTAQDPKRQMVNDILRFALQQLIQALHTEEDLQVLMTIAQAIRQSIIAGLEGLEGTNAVDGSMNGQGPSSSGGGGRLSAVEIKEVCDAFMVSIQQSVQRRAVRAAERQLEEFDEDVEAEMQLELALEDEFRLVVSQSFGEMFPLYKHEFEEATDACFVQAIVDMSHPRRVVSDRKFAIFLIDDLIEHTNSRKHLAKFFNILLANTAEADHALRQAACYGIGVAALRFGQAEEMAQHWMAAVRQIQQVIQAPGAHAGEAVSATDNAISALGKIVRCCPVENKPALAITWLGQLPLKMDIPEAQLNVAALVDMVNANDTNVLGAHGENLPKIAQVLAMSVDVMAPDQLAKSVIILDKIKSAIPPEAMKQVWHSIPQEQRSKLEQIVRNVHA